VKEPDFENKNTFIYTESDLVDDDDDGIENISISETTNEEMTTITRADLAIAQREAEAEYEGEPNQ
jgi:hypothetical protein